MLFCLLIVFLNIDTCYGLEEKLLDNTITSRTVNTCKKRELLLWASHMAVGLTEIGLCSALKNNKLHLPSNESPSDQLRIILCTATGMTSFLMCIPFNLNNLRKYSADTLDVIPDIITLTSKKLAYIPRFLGTFGLGTLYMGLYLATFDQYAAATAIWLSGASVGLALDSALPWLNYRKLKEYATRLRQGDLPLPF